MSRPIGGDGAFLEAGLKETGAETERSDREGQSVKTDVFYDIKRLNVF